MAAHQIATLSKMSSDDFSEQVLYVFGGDANSDEAVAIARKCPSVSIVDVAQVEQLPSFVDGVPVVHVKKNGNVYKGTTCFDFLKTLLDVQVVPAPVTSGAFASSVGITHARAFDTAGAVDGAMVNGIDFDVAAPALATGRVGEADVSAYMARRNERTERAQRKRGLQQGALPPPIKSG